MKLFIFIIGLCIGSFINVVVYRLPKNLNYITHRSRCPICNHKLSYKDMIPVLSYVLLAGKCRYCRSKISIRYLFIEIFSAFLFHGVYIIYGISLQFFTYIVLLIILLIISLIDIDTMIIYDEFIVICLLLVVPFLLFQLVSLEDRIVGIFIISLPMYLCNLYKECFGGGDIKLISLLGLLFGYKDLLRIMYIAFVLGGIISFPLFILKKERRYIPFGPFIFLGVLFVIYS